MRTIIISYGVVGGLSCLVPILSPIIKERITKQIEEIRKEQQLETPFTLEEAKEMTEINDVMNRTILDEFDGDPDGNILDDITRPMPGEVWDRLQQERAMDNGPELWYDKEGELMINTEHWKLFVSSDGDEVDIDQLEDYIPNWSLKRTQILKLLDQLIENDPELINIREAIKQEKIKDAEELEAEALDNMTENLGKEETDVRHDPNSFEAWDAYVEMQMADLTDYNRNILADLWDIPFEPNVENESDDNVLNHIINRRINYFGEDSIYSKSGTFAELYLHYAETYAFNYDSDVNTPLQSWLYFFNSAWNSYKDEIYGEIMNHTIQHVPDGEDKPHFSMFAVPSRYWRYFESNSFAYPNFHDEFNTYMKYIDAPQEELNKIGK